MSAAKRWTLVIVGLLLGNILATLGLIAAAHHGASRVLPEYYERAVHYDDVLDRETQNRALAWRVGIAIHDGTAVVTARDASGQPIGDAHVHIDGVERAATARSVAGDLVATGAGEYRGRIGGAGWIDLTVTVERGTSHYIHQVAIEAR